MPTTAMQKLVAEQIAYERVIQGICERRPDLEPGQVKAQIQRLATTTVDSHHTWATHCLECARQARPLPWETATS
ncbi:hypothetical protein K2E95_00190 [Pseudomonas sp. ERGC3:01]|nr:hypothetical protein [Pseudomonas sp. ERGC3:01]